MAAEETDREPRDIKNHLLFEIATEVAHRGTSAAVLTPPKFARQLTPPCSRRHLFGHQIQVARYHGRIW